MTWRWLIFIIVCASAVFTPEAEGEESGPPVGVADCGPQCVKYLSSYFSRPVTLEEACQMCGFEKDKSQSTSLLAIKRALEEMKLTCSGFRGKLKYLRSEKFPGCAFVVALQEDAHFVVIAKARSADAWLWVDPSAHSVRPLDDSFFERASEHAFLAVCESPIMDATVPQGGDQSGFWLEASIVTAGVALVGLLAVVRPGRKRRERSVVRP